MTVRSDWHSPGIFDRAYEEQFVGLSDEQARAIGRLTVSFNFLEWFLGFMFAKVIDSSQGEEIAILIDRLSFIDKVNRFEALVKTLKAKFDHPEIQITLTKAQRSQAAIDFENMKQLLQRLKHVNSFRNGLIHCRVVPSGTRDGRLLSPRGDIGSDPAKIDKETRLITGLAVSMLRFGDAFGQTMDNYRRARTRILKRRLRSAKARAKRKEGK